MIIASFTPGQSTPPVLSLSFSNPPQIQSIPQMSFNVNLENQNLKKKMIINYIGYKNTALNMYISCNLIKKESQMAVLVNMITKLDTDCILLYINN